MIKDKLGDRLDPLIPKLFPFLFNRPVNPNALTVTGTCVSLAACGLFAHGSFFIGAWMLGFGSFFDLLDGAVARRHGRESAFGAFLDSTLDRLVDMAVLLALVVYFARVGQSEYVALAGYTLVASALVSYAKARAERFIPEVGGGFFERGERLAVIGLGGLTGYMVVALWVVAIGSTITFVQRFAFAYRGMVQEPIPDAEPVGEGVGEHP